MQKESYLIHILQELDLNTPKSLQSIITHLCSLKSLIKLSYSPKFEVFNTKVHEWTYTENTELLKYFTMLYEDYPQLARLSNAFLGLYLAPKIAKYYPDLPNRHIFIATLYVYAKAEYRYFDSQVFKKNATDHGVLIPKLDNCRQELINRGFRHISKRRKSGWFIICHRLDLYYPKRFKEQMDGFDLMNKIAINGITGLKNLQ